MILWFSKFQWKEKNKKETIWNSSTQNEKKGENYDLKKEEYFQVTEKS